MRLKSRIKKLERSNLVNNLHVVIVFVACQGDELAAQKQIDEGTHAAQQLGQTLRLIKVTGP